MHLTRSAPPKGLVTSPEPRMELSIHKVADCSVDATVWDSWVGADRQGRHEAGQYGG